MFNHKWFWFVSLFIVIFLQSFFLISWPACLCLIVFNWFHQETWFVSLSLGLLNDLFLLSPLGKSMLLFLFISLAVQMLKQFFSWEKTYQVKVTDF